MNFGKTLTLRQGLSPQARAFQKAAWSPPRADRPAPAPRVGSRSVQAASAPRNTAR